ncbi:MAG TPA: helix-turn-helix domain-containing protein [Vicinamibacterales bacterium]|nr:helix-turn-helix domain-containing protein [Vicinamibacterales bacterium]
MPARTAPRPRRAASTRPASRDSRDLIFTAAAELFSARGFDGTGVDDIAHAARLNKAMLYYHFDSKLALYREIVRDMLRAVGARALHTADSPEPADARLVAFIAGLVRLSDERPWFPPLMLREIVEGAPRLDPDTLVLMKDVFMAFGRILGDGHRTGLFRPINPILAYMSVLGPILLNAARERAAARPGRLDLPMFADVPHADLTAHMQHAALRLLSPEPTRA